MKPEVVAARDAARRAVSRKKQQQVMDALATAMRDSDTINVSRIAELAGVTRPFIYSHQGLWDAIKAAQAAAAASTRVGRGHGRSPAETTAEAGAESTRRTLAAKVERQKATIADLSKQLSELAEQRSRWLGTQLEQGESVSSEEYAEMILTNDRLANDNVRLKREVEDVRRLNRVLESDLAAARDALSEVSAERSREAGGNVSAISRGRDAPVIHSR